MTFLPLLDAFARVAQYSLPTPQVAWGRFLFQAALVMPLAFMIEGRYALRTRHPWLQFARGALLGVATTFFFASLRFLTMPEAMAIFFVEPLILTLMSAAFLGDSIGWRRITAIAIGFFGAMVVIRPNFVEVGWPAVLPMAAATCFAGYLTLTKRLSHDLGPFGTQALAGLSGLAVLSLVLVAGAALGLEDVAPIWPSLEGWALMAGVGATAAFGHFLIIAAFRQAPAAALAPLQYVEIVPSTMIGYLYFGDTPDPIAWVGVAIIIGAGLFVWFRENQAA